MATTPVEHRCCNWQHVRPCGPIVKLDLHELPFDEAEELCACGCSAHDDRCGGDEWWGGDDPFATFLRGVAYPFFRWLELQPPEAHRSLLRTVRKRGLQYREKTGWVLG